METTSRTVLTFLLNAIWQVPVAAGVAALAARLMRNGPASHRHAVWVVALLSAILLPIASIGTADRSAVTLYEPTLATGGTVAARASAPAASTAVAATAPRTISFAETTALILLGAYALFVLFQLARLAWASIRTAQVLRTAHAGEMPDALRRVWYRCQEAFGLEDVELLFSPNVVGPVAAGRTVILPETLRAEQSEDVLTTAIGHELAHIARHDFACNAFYELLHLPLSFHPAAWVIRAGIERTREMACDELVTRRLIDPGAYARSIVTIARTMAALPGPGYTLGVFDGDILEERIRRLVERPVANLKRARLLLVSGLSALAVCAVLASSLALTARAQSGNAGIKAKLAQAHALLQEYNPGTDPNQPAVTRARQLYLDVLASDRSNLEALHGIMILSTNTKQFGVAHGWAMKTLDVNPTDKEALYTAGFVDWSMTYPDYAKTRTAAGMRPEDPGIIPDGAARLKLRNDHQAQIDDGLRNLQRAIDLDPDFSDAMAYMNLLYRIEAGIVDSQMESNSLIAKADDWVQKALGAKQRTPGHMGMVEAPPPPPPPPPPGVTFHAGEINGATVVLKVRVDNDGKVQNISVISGDRSQVPKAMEAVRKTVYANAPVPEFTVYWRGQ
jgi:beta-lactamase regulating signal transducer with metallopeptidase domain